MNKYKITEDVRYSGSETVTYYVEAENEAEAERLAENYPVEDILCYWNIDVDSDRMKIEALDGEEIRCDKTLDMLAGVA